MQKNLYGINQKCIPKHVFLVRETCGAVRTRVYLDVSFDLEAAHTTGEQVKCKHCTRFALSQLYCHAVINEFRDIE